MKHLYITTKTHPTLNEDIKICSSLNKEFYVVGDGFKIITKKEVESELKSGYIIESGNLTTLLYDLVDKAMPSYIGGDACVIRDLKILLNNI